MSTMTMSQSNYSKFSPSYKQSASSYTTINYVEHKEIVSDPIIVSSLSITDKLDIDHFALMPVYVTQDSDGECLVYKSSAMELNKPYFVVWNGEHFCLVKTDSDIAVYRHEPDEK